MSHKIVLASKNLGKIAEFEHLINSEIISNQSMGQWQILSLSDFPDMPDVDETGITFAENSLLKANEISLYSGLSALSDDSGLCVEALNGEPGVYSARYAGGHGDADANMNKLLSALENTPDHDRAAFFTSVLALVIPHQIFNSLKPAVIEKYSTHINENGDIQITTQGFLHGRIGYEKRGSFGFGYDPIFIPKGDVKSLAEYTPEEKKAISHRAIAMNEMVLKIREIFAN